MKGTLAAKTQRQDVITCTITWLRRWTKAVLPQKVLWNFSQLTVVKDLCCFVWGAAQVQAHRARWGFLGAPELSGKEKCLQQTAGSALPGSSCQTLTRPRPTDFFTLFYLKLSHPQYVQRCSQRALGALHALPVECAAGIPDVESGIETFVFVL